MGKTVNVMAHILQFSFTPMLCIALVPWMCYSHPNGSKSLTKFPEVVCGSTDHIVMLSAGRLLLLCAVAFYATAACCIWMVPNFASVGQIGFLKALRFLLFRFRPDAWWWGLVMMLRSLLMSLAPVLATDDPRMQMIIVSSVLVIFLSLQIYSWPWKVPLLNVLDALISVGLIMVVAITGSIITVDESKASNTRAYDMLLVFILGLTYTSCVAIFALAVLSIIIKGSMATVSDVFLLRRSPKTELLGTLFRKTVVERIAPLTQDSIKSTFEDLPVYDLRTLERIIFIIENSAALTGKGRISWKERSDSIKSSVSMRGASRFDNSAVGAVMSENSDLSELPDLLRQRAHKDHELETSEDCKVDMGAQNGQSSRIELEI